jgi:hypothetical protein
MLRREDGFCAILHGDGGRGHELLEVVDGEYELHERHKEYGLV